MKILLDKISTFISLDLYTSSSMIQFSVIKPGGKCFNINFSKPSPESVFNKYWNLSSNVLSFYECALYVVSNCHFSWISCRKMCKYVLLQFHIAILGVSTRSFCFWTFCNILDRLLEYYLKLTIVNITYKRIEKL